ncbi:maleylpyruvate isomerase family mycothiol-dependent enzyme [Stackebrandtia albiflava]|nr:maleylpyruvate isomerase family mycothiol-dependent enzyme [Stackebrandtia albiflava]
MEFSRFTTGTAAEASALAAAAEGRSDAVVPTCPEWTVADLVHHVAMVYEHKTLCMRTGAPPQPWPPADEGDPVTRLRIALGDLLAEFTGREPTDPTYTWYDPDQTVGFWMRRMAHETTIHRVDAQLAAGIPVTPVDAALAEDGIDEFLDVCAVWGAGRRPERLASAAADATGEAVALVTPGRRRLVTVTPEAMVIAESDAPATATVTGDASALYRWVWRRHDPETVTVEGDTAAVTRLHDVFAAFSQ